MNYIRKKLEIPNFENITEKEMYELLSTKYIHWKYEQEIRIFSTLEDKQDEHYFINFSEDLVLKEVIIGFNSKTTKEEIIQNYGSSDISIFKVRPAFQTFKMVKNRAIKF